MNILLRPIIILIVSFWSISTYAQTVDSVSYYVGYNENTCLYDCHIIIEKGSATGIAERWQFLSNYTLVAPTGTTLNIEESYMPLENNFTYTGTVPSEWLFGAPTDSGNGETYYMVIPTLSPGAQYNNLAEGDTVRIFSASLTPNNNCGTGLRLFENGVDQNVNGGNVNSSFKIGGPIDVFDGLNPIDYPGGPIIPVPTVNTQNGISIDLTLDAMSCQSPYTTLWTGPNSYASLSEDVIINPATAADYGTFKLVVENAIGCKDSIEILVEEPTGPMMNEITVENVKYTPTFEHIGIHVDISGDDNANSTMDIEYKIVGTADWSEGAMTMRAKPLSIVDGIALGSNFHAGSAMHLNPYTQYDIRVTITDPDGGTMVIENQVTTRKFPTAGFSDNKIYVVPGNGGGDGSQSNPYQGLQKAIDNVQPGSVLEVGDGVYDPFVITISGTETMPIMIKSTNLHGAIIQGGDTSTGIVTIGSASDSIRYITIDGFDIKNGKWGIDAQNTQYLTVRNNKITDVDWGFYNRRELGWENHQYINNNEIIGRTSWPQLDGAIPQERGVDIRGNANVVSHNSISNFGDAISTDGPLEGVSFALDIHNNEITRIVDDIIEVDGTVSNSRVYENRGLNGRSGVSIAPMLGGPAYIFKNVLFNLENSAFKLNNGTSGVIIVNNSVAKAGRGLTSPAGWQNTVFKNNVVLSSHYIYEEFGLVDGSIDDWNNNAYYSLRSGTASEPWFKWNAIKYNTLVDINMSGLSEGTSVAASYSDFNSVVVPSAYSIEALISDVDFTLTNTSDLIDGGVSLGNIVDYDTQGMSVDIGAYESGGNIPSYGHDFGSICSRNSLIMKTWNGSQSEGWFNPWNWTPCGAPEKISNVFLPGGILPHPVINTDFRIKNLDVLGNAQLNIKGDVIMTLDGDN